MLQTNAEVRSRCIYLSEKHEQSKEKSRHCSDEQERHERGRIEYEERTQEEDDDYRAYEQRSGGTEGNRTADQLCPVRKGA